MMDCGHNNATHQCVKNEKIEANCIWGLGEVFGVSYEGDKSIMAQKIQGVEDTNMVATGGKNNEVEEKVKQRFL